MQSEFNNISYIIENADEMMLLLVSTVKDFR